MDPTTDSTNIDQQGAVTSAADNPSNGLSSTDLFSQLIGTAGQAYVANQQSQAAQAIGQAQVAAAYAQPANPLAVLTTGSGRTWLLIGGGVLALALILRR
jgi:hypothetical protein